MRRTSRRLLSTGFLALLWLLSALDAHEVQAAPNEEWLDFGNLRNTRMALPALADERAERLAEAGVGYAELEHRVAVRLRSDGSIERREVSIRQYLTGAGVETAGEPSIDVLPSYQTLKIESAFVITSGGDRVPVDPSVIQVADVAEPQLFTGHKRVVVPLPGLAPGARSVLVSSLVFRAGEWPLPTAFHLYLQGFAPIERVEARVQWDPGVTEPLWRSDDDQLVCRSEPRALVCDREDIPPMAADADIGLAMDHIPALIVAPPRTWSEVARDVRRLVDRSLAEGVPAGFVERLVGDAADDEEKFRLLFAFVANEIRYLGLEHGSNAVVPRPPATTLQRRFGDCKDKVTLLIGLAERAGIDAYPVLVATRQHEDAPLMLPSSHYFDHMVVCMARGDRDPLCGDPTVSHATLEESIVPTAGRIVLDLRPETGGPGWLAYEPYGSKVRIQSDVELGCDGGVRTTTTRELSSLGKLNLRATHGSLPARDLDRFLVEEDLRVRGATARAEISVDSLGSGTEPIRISTTHARPGQSALTESYQHYDNDYWLRSYGFSLRSENRVYPIWNPGLEVVSKRRYRLCPSLRPRHMGAQLALEDEVGSFERSYRPTAEGVEVESVLRLPSGVATPARILRTNSFLDRALDQSVIWFDTKKAR